MRALVGAFAVVMGCTVDDAYLSNRLFLCSAPTECGEGWGCVDGNPYAQSFCAPQCDAMSCGGVCTGGAESLCLHTCRIWQDGTPSPCVPQGTSCVRTSIEYDTGICHSATPCRETRECAENEVCLTEVLNRTAPPGSLRVLNNLYCVTTAPDKDSCPENMEALGYTEPLTLENPNPATLIVCTPTCTVARTSCPPAFGCVTQLARAFGGVGLCAPGTYGFACESDANCFVGRCLETRPEEGRLCTITCNEAVRFTGGCQNLISPLSTIGSLYTMGCDPAAGTPAEQTEGGLCAPRYSIGYPFCTQVQGGVECAEGLMCEAPPGRSVNVCTRPCETHAECNEELRVPEAEWPYCCLRGYCDLEGRCAGP